MTIPHSSSSPLTMNTNLASTLKKKKQSDRSNSTPPSTSNLYFVSVFKEYGLIYQSENEEQASQSSSSSFPSSVSSSSGSFRVNNLSHVFGLSLPPYQFKINLKKAMKDSSWNTKLPQIETSIQTYANQSILHLCHLLSPLLNVSTSTSSSMSNYTSSGSTTTTTFQESFLQLLLNIESFQSPITRFMCGCIMQYSGLPEADHYHLLPLLLHPFKWLDHIEHPNQFTQPFLELLHQLDEQGLKELIPVIPEIFPESEHPSLLQLFTSFFKDHPALTITLVDALSNIVIPLTSPSWIPLIETISQCLVSAQEHEVPLVLRFLLNINPSISFFSPQERIAFIRSHLDISDLSNVTLVLEEYRVALRRYKALYTAYKHLFLQLTSPVESTTSSSSKATSATLTTTTTSWQDIDVLVWIMMGSLSPTSCKDMERVLKTCMLNQTFLPSHFENVLAKYTNCLQPYHATLLSFVHAFFTLFAHSVPSQGPSSQKKKNNHPPNSSHLLTMTPCFKDDISLSSSMNQLNLTYAHALVHAFVVSPFPYFDIAHQQDWMAILVAYVGSGTSVQVDMALALLSKLADTCAMQMVPFTLLIKGLLDYLDNLSLVQIRSLLMILSKLAFADLHAPHQLSSHPTLDVLSILARKGLARFHMKQKAIGVVTMLVLIKIYASQCWVDHPDIEVCFSMASDLLSACDQACTEPKLRAFFYDQFAFFIEPYHEWHPGFLPFVFHTYIDQFLAFTHPSAISSAPIASSSSHHHGTPVDGTSSDLPFTIVDLSLKQQEGVSGDLVTEVNEWDSSFYVSAASSTNNNDRVQGPEASLLPPTLFFLHDASIGLPSLLRLIYAASKADPSFQTRVLPFFEARFVASASMKTFLIMYLQQCIHCLPNETNVLVSILSALAKLDPMPVTSTSATSKAVKSKSTSQPPPSSITPTTSSSSSSSSASLFPLEFEHRVFPEQVFETVLPTCKGTDMFSYVVSAYFQFLQSCASPKLPSTPLLLCLCETLVDLSHAEPSASSSTLPLMTLIFQILGTLIQQHAMNRGFVFSDLAQGLYPLISSSPSFDAVTQDPFAMVFDFFSAFVPSAATPTLAKLIFQFLLLLHACGCPASSDSASSSSSVWRSRFHDIAADYLGQLSSLSSSASSSAAIQVKSNVLEFFLTQELSFADQPLIRLREYTDALMQVVESSSVPASMMHSLLTKVTFVHFYKICFRRLSLQISSKVISAFDTLTVDEILAEPLLDFLSNITPIFVDLVHLTKLRDQKPILQIALNEGSKFVSQYTLLLFPAISKRFLRSPKLFLEWIKKMQPGTRQLQAICGYSKVCADPLLISQVPKTRKILESFLQAAKWLLIQNQCEDAWWIGSLKHRDMQGQVVSSQVPYSASQEEDSQHEDSASEAPESEVDSHGDGVLEERTIGLGKIDLGNVANKSIGKATLRRSRKRKALVSSDEEDIVTAEEGEEVDELQEEEEQEEEEENDEQDEIEFYDEIEEEVDEIAGEEDE